MFGLRLGASARHDAMTLAEAAGASIFQNAYDPMHVIRNGILVECNPAFERVMGYRRDEMIGKSPVVLSPERQPNGRTSADLAVEVIGKAMQEGRNRFEWMHVAKDGRPVPVIATLIRDVLHGEEVIVSILQDQTTQRDMIDQLSAGLAALADGDLSHRLTKPFVAEYEALRENYNRSAEGLADLIGAAAASTQTIASGASEIARASEDLARRTESNAASLEQTSAAMAQIEARVRGVAATAVETAERATAATGVVETGRSTAEQAVEAMRRVAESAEGIDGVIEGLDKIAFQTRVLAMNAAVEAGRAGEAGRGFAVVADLVSALAMRAEEEAKRARDQLTVTQSQVRSAVSAVQNVDAALTDIRGNVGAFEQLLDTMVRDNQAQASAVTQITAAIGTMDRATQENAAMVEETSAAARNLLNEVDLLNDQSSRFRLTAAPSSGFRAVTAVRRMAVPVLH